MSWARGGLCPKLVSAKSVSQALKPDIDELLARIRIQITFAGEKNSR